ncbi:hypothetical protein [Actinoplanes sp. URMC 104]|uniref:hypothetical protein n=1 Tax=Actinoplanes sp. URMC 104 TaxID=3423409 RepID=UPI003F1C26BC
MVAGHVHVDPDQVSVSHLSDTLGVAFFPAMVWLLTGLTATVGDGDPHWLTTIGQ